MNAFKIFFRLLFCLGIAVYVNVITPTYAQTSVSSDKFEDYFQEYLDDSRDRFNACSDQFCFENLDFPVFRIDSLNQLNWWNGASLQVNPHTFNKTWIKTENITFWHISQPPGYHALIPVEYSNSRNKTEFLKSKIHPSASGFDYKLDLEDSAVAVNAKVILSEITGKLSPPGVWVALYFLAMILVLVIILKLARNLIRFFGHWYGTSLTILICTSIRLLFGLPFLASSFEGHPIFQHQIQSSLLSPSLGELFMNMLLFFFISIFLFQQFDKRPTKPQRGLSRWYMLLFGYALVISSIIFFVDVVKRVVVESSISFQFDKIYVLDWNTHVFILSILLFISALFFLSYLLIKILNASGAKLNERLLVFTISGLLTYPIFANFSLHISAFAFYILILAVLVLMDLFVESNQKSVSWLVIWLATISTGTTALLYAHGDLAYQNEAERNAFNINKEITKASDPRTPLDIDKELNWAIYDGGELIIKSGTISSSVLKNRTLPISGESIHFNIDNERVSVYRPQPGTLIILSKPEQRIIEFISLFSFLFTSLSIVVFLIFLFNSFFLFLPQSWNFTLFTGSSIRRQIQYVIFSVLVLSFGTVFVVTSFYLRAYNKVDTGHQLSLKNISIDYLNSLMDIVSEDSINQEIATNWPHSEVNFFIFDSNGRSITSNNKSGFYRPPFELVSSPKVNDGFTPSEMVYSDAVFKLYRNSNQTYILGVSVSEDGTTPSYFFNNLLGTLLNLYIFLFIIASSIALTFSDKITRPLQKLREKFSNMKIGQANERIDWQSKDEVGQLIEEYNVMIEKIEESVNTLTMTEREVAWREMAKQVAHEIKNPLTPMKLSLQHLQLSIQREPDRAPEMINRVGKTLLEQIDNLSKIASEFSNFAKMPKPENKKVVLNDVASSVHDLFRKREDMDINLYIPIDEIFVFGDKHYITRVLINLLKNATQAIPNSRRGEIDIHVYKDEENAIIKVTDNGSGIPDSIKDKVFQPNFTSKNSGTGLGLAICANIIESFNGKIYFETIVDAGTTFYIEIPLMHMADNFRESEHVIL